MPPATDRAIRELLCGCFPSDAEAYARSRAWHDSAPEFTVLARHEDQIVGHLAIVVRSVLCGDLRLTVAGVQSFCVAVGHRGTGLARQLMGRALGEARRRAIPFGLLFCVPELTALYHALGWSRTDRSVVMRDRHGKRVPIPAKNVCMSVRLGDERLPSGPLDLQGRDW